MIVVSAPKCPDFGPFGAELAIMTPQASAADSHWHIVPGRYPTTHHGQPQLDTDTPHRLAYGRPGPLRQRSTE
jgi:hypothetical protein